MKQQRRQERNLKDKQQYRLELKGTNNLVISKWEEKKAKKKSQSSWFYIGYVGQIGYATVLPIAGGGLLGGYIDRQLSTYPKATLLLLLGGTVISVFGFVRTIRELMNANK